MLFFQLLKKNYFVHYIYLVGKNLADFDFDKATSFVNKYAYLKFLYFRI